VDSSLLVTLASQALGERVLAVTADSPLLPRADLRDARALARRLKLRHRVRRTAGMPRRRLATNPPDRLEEYRTGSLNEALRQSVGNQG
jgi:uncharacterized protein